MRALTVLLALVATPFLVGVAQQPVKASDSSACSAPSVRRRLRKLRPGRWDRVDGWSGVR